LAEWLNVGKWLGAGVVGGFSGRHGGVSKGIFESLNVGLHVPDRPTNVQSNRALVAKHLSITPAGVTYAQQVHGKAVAVVDRRLQGRGAFDHADALPGVDALVTRESNLALAVLTADCVPLLLADSQASVAAVAHAGWRGATAGVVTATVRAMEDLGADVLRIRVVIGPAIRGCCYEVDLPVIRAVTAAYRRFAPGAKAPELPRSARSIGAVMLDLPTLCSHELASLGVHPDHILDTSVCTSCMDGYFSHRRDHGATGRQGGFICLKG